MNIINPIKISEFDVVHYLTNDEVIAEYITAAIEENEPDFLLQALNDVARARGMSNIAALSGLGRESLYKALSPGAKPRFETILKITKALGLRFTVHTA